MQINSCSQAWIFAPDWWQKSLDERSPAIELVANTTDSTGVLLDVSHRLLTNHSICDFHAGVFAFVKEGSIVTPLTYQTRSRTTPPKSGTSSCVVPLYLTAGTLGSGTPVATTRHVVTVLVSYWSEACQPKQHAIKGLTDNTEQVLARQATLTLHVDVNRHLRVASVLCQPASGTELSCQENLVTHQGLGNLEMTVQAVRHGTDNVMMVRHHPSCRS